MDSFKKMVPQSATVVRGGETTVVDAVNLTLGDVIEVKGGDKLPADVRIIECSTFKVCSVDWKTTLNFSTQVSMFLEMFPSSSRKIRL